MNIINLPIRYSDFLLNMFVETLATKMVLAPRAEKFTQAFIHSTLTEKKSKLSIPVVADVLWELDHRCRFPSRLWPAFLITSSLADFHLFPSPCLAWAPFLHLPLDFLTLEWLFPQFDVRQFLHCTLRIPLHTPSCYV